MALWLIFAVLLAKFFPTLFFCLIGMVVAYFVLNVLWAILVGFFTWVEHETYDFRVNGWSRKKKRYAK